MSHFTTIQTQIRDLDALNDACVEMGFKFLPNVNCRGYAGITRKAPHVIQLKGPMTSPSIPRRRKTEVMA